MKPFSESCVQNAAPILAVITPLLDNRHSVLEIGSGTGQHAVFSANSVHIMHLAAVEALFNGVGELLTKQGLFILYGPFNYGACYTSESNACFSVISSDGEVTINARGLWHPTALLLPKIPNCQ